jgi:hypothetical protein
MRFGASMETCDCHCSGFVRERQGAIALTMQNRCPGVPGAGCSGLSRKI